MALVPFRYNLRSLFGRSSATALTLCAIGATVAVLAGMLSLQQGFVTLFQERGRSDLAIFLRKSATSEGESGITREQCAILTKEVPELLRDAQDQPLASAELFLAVRLRKFDGGERRHPRRRTDEFCDPRRRPPHHRRPALRTRQR
jgi:hypothetical protein